MKWGLGYMEELWPRSLMPALELKVALCRTSSHVLRSGDGSNAHGGHGSRWMCAARFACVAVGTSPPLSACVRVRRCGLEGEGVREVWMRTVPRDMTMHVTVRSSGRPGRVIWHRAADRSQKFFEGVAAKDNHRLHRQLVPAQAELP